MIERGKITRVLANKRQVYVEVPKLGLGVEYGPCDVLWVPETGDADVGPTSHDHGATATASTSVTPSVGSGGDPLHTHPASATASTSVDVNVASASVGAATHSHKMPPLTVGMKVIVATIHGSPDDVVVLGIIA
jgi:hypothetical protein